MANTFTLQSAAYNGRYLQLECVQSPNVAGNYSDIAWTLTVTGGSSNYYSTGPTEVKIAGTQVYYCPRKAYSTKTFPAAKGSTGGTLRVYHDASDGSCTVAVSLSTAIYEASVHTVSGSWSLDSIARVSEISATQAHIETASTVVVTRRNPAFTHSVAYQFGSLQGYVSSAGKAVDAEEIFSETTVNFTLPESFYTQIPNAQAGEGVLTCRTYWGDTLIGTETCTLIALTGESRCGPSVQLQVEDVEPVSLALTGDKTKLIRYVSTARCQVTATAQKSASIVSRQVEGNTLEEAYWDFPKTEHAAYRATATDSRGYTVTQTDNCELVPYVLLTCNAYSARKNPGGNEVTLTVMGNCYKGSFGAAENTLRLWCQVGEQELPMEPVHNDDHTYTAQLILTEMDYTKTHTVTVFAQDAVGPVSDDVVVKPGIPVFDWGRSDFVFHVPVTLPLLNGRKLPIYQFCIDADQTLENGFYWIGGSTKNAPENTAMLLVFRGEEEIVQIALSYNASNRKIRSIFHGTDYGWQDW